MHKTLTISIAAYNVEEYLEKTLVSLIPPQDNDMLEVIVVDDGSKDRTAEIAETFCSKYPGTFKLIKKANGGYGSTINAALKQATGKYFKLLDGDDWFRDGILEDYLSFLGETDSHIVISPYNVVHMPEKRYELVDTHKNLPDKPVSIKETDITESVTHQELTIRTDILKDTEITEHCFYTDQEFVFGALLKAATMVKYTQPVYCYRVGREGQSVSLSGLRKHYPDTVKVARKLFASFDGNRDEITAGKRSVLVRKIKGAASMVYTAYMARDDVKKAKRELMEFDEEIKRDHPEIYEITNDLKRARILRRSRFTIFSILCVFSKKALD